jgi:hypothetical protein
MKQKENSMLKFVNHVKPRETIDTVRSGKLAYLENLRIIWNTALTDWKVRVIRNNKKCTVDTALIKKHMLHT